MNKIVALTALLLLGAGCVQNNPTVPVPNTNVSFRPPQSAPPPSTAVVPTDTSGTPPSNTPESPKPAPVMDTKNPPEFPGVLPPVERVGKKIRIKTTKGDIVFEMFGEEAPLASSNFVWLTKNKFYDGLTFHRRESWVLQGGDPDGNGTGGPGWRFRDEPVTRDYTRGIVAMANSGPNTNGSQFFIMLNDTPLEKNYTIFGQVVAGMDVVDAMKMGDVMTKVTIE